MPPAEAPIATIRNRTITSQWLRSSPRIFAQASQTWLALRASFVQAGLRPQHPCSQIGVNGPQ